MLKKIVRSQALVAGASLLLAAFYWLVGRTNRVIRDPAQDFYAPFDNGAVIVALWHGEHFLIPFLPEWTRSREPLRPVAGETGAEAMVEAAP